MAKQRFTPPQLPPPAEHPLGLARLEYPSPRTTFTYPIYSEDLTYIQRKRRVRYDEGVAVVLQ